MIKNAFIFAFLLVLVSCNDKAQKENTSKTTQRWFPELKSDRYNAAFLIMDGVYNTEFTAPYDIFQHTKFRKKHQGHEYLYRGQHLKSHYLF